MPVVSTEGGCPSGVTALCGLGAGWICTEAGSVLGARGDGCFQWSVPGARLCRAAPSAPLLTGARDRLRLRGEERCLDKEPGNLFH